MAAEHETITDFFGKEYVVVPKFGPIPCEGVVGVVMTSTQEVMKEVCKEWPDEEVVFIYSHTQVSPQEISSRIIAIAEWDRLKKTEYILVSGVTNSGHLSIEQLLMIKEVGLPARAFGLSIRNFINDIEFKPWNKVYDHDSQTTLHNSASTLTQIATARENDARIRPISPVELINKLPFSLKAI